MKPIRFTYHALDKVSAIREQGFLIDTSVVISVIRNPQRIFSGHSGRAGAQAALDAGHVLRVVYEESPTEIVVVTLYPGRRRQYEN